MKRLRAPAIPTVTVAIDPAIRTSGLAWRIPGESIKSMVHQDVEHIGRAVEAVAQCLPECRLDLILEYPTWGGHGTESVRLAANAWERAFRALWPRRIIVSRVAPQAWMKRLGRIPRGTDAHTLYTPVARGLAGLLPEDPLDPNEAAAICILDYREVARG